MMNKRTADERYVIALYETALATGDVHAPFNRHEIGKMIHLQERGVNATCKLLVQANFVKKSNEDGIYLTKNGEALALRLLEEG